jgi:hypothetical protein
MLTSIDQIREETILNVKNFSKKKVKLYNTEVDKLETNYTINFFPYKKIQEKLGNVIELFKLKYPDHEYMNTNNLHITILGLISMDTQVNNIINFIKQNIPRELKFKIAGMDLSESAASFLAFSQNMDMKKVRNMFKKEVSSQVKKYWGRYEDIGWINFVRFCKKPSQSFYTYILNNINLNIGIVKGRVRLLKSSSRTLKGAETIFEL